MTTIHRLCIALVVAALLALAPRSLMTFANNWQVGDVFVGVGDTYGNPKTKGDYLLYDSQGHPRNQTIHDRTGGYTTGCYYSPTSHTLWTTSFDGLTVNEFDGLTQLRSIDLRTVIPNAAAVESIAFTFDSQGHTSNFFVGLPWSGPGGGPNLAEFLPSGAFLKSYFVPKPTEVLPGDLPAGANWGAVDWIDTAVEAGHRIVYYTDESLRTNPPVGYRAAVFRYDVDADPPQTEAEVFGRIPDAKAFALRLLPNNDGMLVAGTAGVYRFTKTGELYPYPFFTNAVDYFALNIAPDGEHFWTASAATGQAFKFHIASQALVAAVETGERSVFGLCIVNEYTAAENKCTASNGAPIDPCPKLEYCRNGLDDDGDGLNDGADPDCVAPGTAEVCNDPGGNDEDRDGLINEVCPHTSYTGHAINEPFAGIRLPGDTYTATGLPSPLEMDLTTALVTGVLPDSSAGTYRVTVTVSRNGHPVGSGEFDWTFLTEGAQPPVCSGAVPAVSVIWPPNGKMVDVSILEGSVTAASGDAQSIAIRFDGIEQDEPTNTEGDRNTPQDGWISPDRLHASVRAERAGTPKVPGDGRMYRISFTATDTGGATCAGKVSVGVPHDQRGAAAAAGSVWYNSLTGDRIP